MLREPGHSSLHTPADTGNSERINDVRQDELCP